ncbi:flagellar basal body L-ring protein FlgH [Shewanella litorisediminis]|uniref:Flagellar L-ring protein n=1 Tax=Shewanella litorisediminis TaxID=1173586 RepID=A0ABX7FZW4_9GAMM|nr:flagellar basal body L-ring protein FlgH [Shewanella litorisediminis]MCL2919695.1 flagellar basal body L-ring protein FlgH [Shewanella litorisediminis]QRH00579.1 flagellar basal body L-ring protein FlgH [Shewanella litorisediminis]
MLRYLMVGSLLVLAGCASTEHKPIPDDPYYAPVVPEEPPVALEPTGSIFLDSQAASLYTDIRAHRVGDIITVVLTESTQATKSANNEIKKGSDLNMDAIQALGGPVTISGNPLSLGYSDSMNTKREADADQSNSLRGNISAHVLQVLANGNLVIRGEKWISINNGDEFIRVTGVIRPQDITTDNKVESTRVANARIQYSGTGTFANSQQVGWLSQFFLSDWWPF